MECRVAAAGGMRRMAAHSSTGWALRLLLATELFSLAQAWSESGHERMARIAESLLKGKHKDQVRTMMHGDLVDFADFEIKMSKQHPQTAVLHWHRQTPEWTCEKGIGIDKKLHCDDKEASLDSMMCGAAAFFKRYAHDALLESFPKAEDPLWVPTKGYTWFQTTDWYIKMHKLESVVKSKATELRWLVTLLGDMHMPLHWLKEHDYGKDIRIAYKGEEYSLLQFWEDYLPKNVPPVDYNEVEKAYESVSKNWRNHVPYDLFRDWAQKTAQIACHSIYDSIAVNHADFGREIPHSVELTDDQYKAWEKVAQDTLQIGGMRVAFVLLDLIEHRKHAIAHKDGRALVHRHNRHMRNFGINLGIAVVLVPSLLLFLRWHERAGGPSFIHLCKKHLKV